LGKVIKLWRTLERTPETWAGTKGFAVFSARYPTVVCSPRPNRTGHRTNIPERNNIGAIGMGKHCDPGGRKLDRSGRRSSDIVHRRNSLKQYFLDRLGGRLGPLGLRRELSRRSRSTKRWCRMQWSRGLINHVGTGFDLKVVAIFGWGHPYTELGP
jgi:hypothetical protein